VNTSKKQLQEVRRRARKIQEKKGWGYGKAMRTAGWMVARAAGERKQQ